jgi:hypothetical protein
LPEMEPRSMTKPIGRYNAHALIKTSTELQPATLSQGKHGPVGASAVNGRRKQTRPDDDALTDSILMKRLTHPLSDLDFSTSLVVLPFS